MNRRWQAMLLCVALAAGGFWWWNSRQEVGSRELIRMERYCPYAIRLDEALASAEVGGGVDAEQFFAQVATDVERIEGDAPGQLRDEVRTVIGALRQAREGDISALESPRFAEARNRLASFQRESCIGGEAGTE